MWLDQEGYCFVPDCVYLQNIIKRRDSDLDLDPDRVYFHSQAAGFRREAFVSLEHENAFGTGPTRSISAKTYMRLR